MRRILRAAWKIARTAWKSVLVIAALVGILYLPKDIKELPEAVKEPQAFFERQFSALRPYMTRETALIVFAIVLTLWVAWKDARPFAKRWWGTRSRKHVDSGLRIFVDPPKILNIEWRDPNDEGDLDAIIHPRYVSDGIDDNAPHFFITNHDEHKITDVEIHWKYECPPLDIFIKSCPFFSNFETRVGEDFFAIALMREHGHSAHQTIISYDGNMKIRSLSPAPDDLEAGQHPIKLPPEIATIVSLFGLWAAHKQSEIGLAEAKSIDPGTKFSMDEFVESNQYRVFSGINLFELSVLLKYCAHDGSTHEQTNNFQLVFHGFTSPIFATDTEGKPHISLPSGRLSINPIE